jgi:hypothetical protein
MFNHLGEHLSLSLTGSLLTKRSARLDRHPYWAAQVMTSWTIRQGTQAVTHKRIPAADVRQVVPASTHPVSLAQQTDLHQTPELAGPGSAAGLISGLIGLLAADAATSITGRAWLCCRPQGGLDLADGFARAHARANVVAPTSVR